MLPQPTGALLPTQNQQLTKNPMLPQLPNTGNMDSQYLAQEAQLRAQISRQYADILQQLGYIDEQGNFLPGSISTNAARSQQDLQRQEGLAAEGAMNQATRTGTGHSGRLGVNTERATQPYERQLAQLGVDTPLALGKQYEQAAGLIDQYTLQNNLFLASMAARQAAAITANPAGAPGNQNTGEQQNTNDTGGGGGGGGGTKPYEDPVEQLPAPIVNQNPEAPGQVFTPVTVGGETSFEPKPNPGSYGQPDPVIVSPGGPMAPGSQLVGPDEMPKPNPGSYDQPIPDLPPVADILDTINNAIAATPGDMAAGQAALNVKPKKVPNQSNKGNLI